MKTPPVDQKQFDLVVHWIKERESIRKLKAAGAPKPWTADPLLRDYRWCNVSRMDDRVSVELMTQWYSDNGARAQLVAATLGRLINWPESLLSATDGRPFSMSDLPKMRGSLRARQECGMKIFTGAYVVPGIPGMNKIDSVMNLAELISAKSADLLKPTLRATWEALTQLDGLGSFLAGQIAADLAQLTTGEEWHDRFTFAPVGPGSARGLNRFFGRPFKRKMSQAQFDEELPIFTELIRSKVPEIFDDRKLCAQDLQSANCETDKARRLLEGEGQVRARYDGIGPAVKDSNQRDLFSQIDDDYSVRK